MHFWNSSIVVSWPCGQAPKKSKVKGEGQIFEQVMKRFLFSWPSFEAQVSSNFLYDPSYMLREETSGTMFGSKIQVVKLSPRLACFLVMFSLSSPTLLFASTRIFNVPTPESNSQRLNDIG